MLEKTLVSPLDCKEIPPVSPKGDQSWVFIGRTDDEAETPILWPPHAKSWLIGKDPDVGRDLGAGEEGDSKGWDGWMASLTQWAWVWVNSGSWWWTGKPGVLQFMGSQSWTRLSDWTEFVWWFLMTRFRLQIFDRNTREINEAVFSVLYKKVHKSQFSPLLVMLIFHSWLCFQGFSTVSILWGATLRLCQYPVLYKYLSSSFSIYGWFLSE